MRRHPNPSSTLRWTVLVALLSVSAASAQPAAPLPSPRGKRTAIVPFDALGIDAQRVIKLESLFRNEIERLTGRTGSARREITSVMSSRRFRSCAGATKCLAQIGAKLKVDLVVSGNVAALGESYVVNIKAIDVSSRSELNRVSSDPLKGNPDELIEAVRIAAYRLLAPKELIGSITLLADVDGASVIVDGKIVGTTQLNGPIERLSLGKHKISVTREGFSKFSREITVRFQKTTKVVVRLATGANSTRLSDSLKQGTITRSAPRPWYKSTWFIVGVGAAAVTAGAIIGYRLGKDDVIDCSGGSSACAVSQ